MTTWVEQPFTAPAWGEGGPRLAEIVQLHRHSLMNVLLTGGSAQGRAALARTLHDSSPVASGPFVRLDCREDELLLAASLRLRRSSAAGRAFDPLRACARGTLYLDRVEALSRDTQRLLAATLGEPTEGAPAWVGRLIAGCGVELMGACDEGQFLRELFDVLDKVSWVLDPESPGTLGGSSERT